MSGFVIQLLVVVSRIIKRRPEIIIIRRAPYLVTLWRQKYKNNKKKNCFAAFLLNYTASSCCLLKSCHIYKDHAPSFRRCQEWSRALPFHKSLMTHVRTTTSFLMLQTSWMQFGKRQGHICTPTMRAAATAGKAWKSILLLNYSVWKYRIALILNTIPYPNLQVFHVIFYR